jgi:signal peptidase I
MKPSLISAIIDLVEILFIGVAVFVLVYLFIGQPLEISGTSMEPTLHDKEMIIAEKLSSKMAKLERGDIIVFKQPENRTIFVIKRIIGLPGETVHLKQGEAITVNGTSLTEKYLKKESPFTGEEITITVPQGSFYLMGDNRKNSTDSRKWGPIPQEDIVGKAVLVFNPISEARIINHAGTVKDLTQKVFRMVEALEHR